MPARAANGVIDGNEKSNTNYAPDFFKLVPTAQTLRDSLRVIAPGHGLDAAREALRRGLALVSEERRRYGLVLEESIGFNLSLSSLARTTSSGVVAIFRNRSCAARLWGMLRGFTA